LDGGCDAVLVDAPCSGIGSFRREVDLRWRIREDDLAGLPDKQLTILRKAARFVRRGGCLVYATCSPLRMEDEEVVGAFLAADSGFEQVDAAVVLGSAAAVERGALRLWPERHDTGAFFAARFRRVQ